MRLILLFRLPLNSLFKTLTSTLAIDNFHFITSFYNAHSFVNFDKIAEALSRSIVFYCTLVIANRSFHFQDAGIKLFSTADSLFSFAKCSIACV